MDARLQCDSLRQWFVIRQLARPETDTRIGRHILAITHALSGMSREAGGGGGSHGPSDAQGRVLPMQQREAGWNVLPKRFTHTTTRSSSA
jgi:hypothetical protein